MNATRPLTHESVEDNLRFLIREVEAQLIRTRSYIVKPTEGMWQTLLRRDNYIDNLRTFIQRACFSHAVTAERVEYLKALDVIAVNLERIADFCADVIGQLHHLPDATLIAAQPFDAFFDEVLRAVHELEQAVLQLDVHRALSVCRAEPRLDTLFATQREQGIAEIAKGGSPDAYVTLVFVWHYFERMGDSLLNIGEAIISAALGEKIKIGQLWALEDSLGGVQQRLDDVILKPVGESRSGCRIVRVATREPSAEATAVIFKEGDYAKLEQEREGIELWEALVPGTAPKVYSFNGGKMNGALLLEYLPGQTFEELLLQRDPELLGRAFSLVTKSFEEVWLRTRTATPVPSTFTQQLRKRLPDVYAIHPRFRGTRKDIGPIKVLPLHDLLDVCERLELEVPAPFGVLTHGDCNIDNIICDLAGGRMRLIDLHRARVGDYVQDVSVFLVSNFRLQIFEAPVRRRINDVVAGFHKFAGEFAARSGDQTFSVRLALGLARSFATSARFVLDDEFANALFLRARYLVDQLLKQPPEDLHKFRLPEEILID